MDVGVTAWAVGAGAGAAIAGNPPAAANTEHSMTNNQTWNQTLNELIA